MRVPVLLLIVSLAAAAQAEAPQPKLTRHSVEGGSAVILASLLDRVKLSANGTHGPELRCVIDGGKRDCSKAKATPFELRAARINCQESHIAVGQFDCTLSLKSPQGKDQSRQLSGHAAFELMSIIEQAGVPSEGAAGHEAVGAVAVKCSLDMQALLDKAGGGAKCELFGEAEQEEPAPRKPPASPNN